jgi:hypothetical protein
MTGDWRCGENYVIFSPFNLEEIYYKKHTLALINFFGTLAWGKCGELKCMDSDKLILSSPFVDLILDELKLKGYTTCILEIYRDKYMLENIKKCIKNFILKNKINAPIILLSYKAIKDINKILYEIFKPSYKFGVKSFYCGDEIDLFDANPWYRINDTDSVIAKHLKFKLLNPDNIFSCFLSYTAYFTITSLIITCGQEYSGYDMLYESIETDINHLGMECKVKKFMGKTIYFIQDYEINQYFLLNETITINKDEHYVIVGSHSSFKERNDLVYKFKQIDRNKFPIDLPDSQSETSLEFVAIAWFSKYPYEWSSSYKQYIKDLESPENTGEKWFRLN